MSNINLGSNIYNTNASVKECPKTFISKGSLQGRSVILVLSAIVFMALACNNDGDGTGETFRNPPEIKSSNGVLYATFRLNFSKIKVADQKVTTRIYNGTFVPPTLRVRPGDVIRVKLRNFIDEMTNIHYHGMNVSPLGNSDNIFNMIIPTQTFDYEVVIPENHPEGLFYYHSHAMGLSEFQVFSGESGGLIVEGILDPFPQLRGIKERVMLLKDIQITPDGTVPMDIDSNAPTNRTINGLVNPTIKIRPGETQFWRIGNIGADIYYRLKLDGHIMYEIARDGNRHNQLVPREEIFLPTSSRVEVLIQGGPKGVYEFRTLPINMGPQGDQYPEVTLATLISEGLQEEPVDLPTKSEFPQIENLCDKPIDPENKKFFVFSENADGTTFFINGQQFDPNVINTMVELGDIQEWTIQNTSEEFHVFHIHQLDFQVCEENGVKQEFIGRQDTVNLPFTTNGVPGEVKIVIPFTDPVILGKFVYHCHIMAHEDNGMMAVIEVCDNGFCPGE